MEKLPEFFFHLETIGFASLDVSLEELSLIASRIALNVKPGFVLFLSGDLGVGKTAFCKLFINSILPNEDVRSPTFPIVNVYESSSFSLWHCDLYRVGSYHEVEELGILDAAIHGSVLLVEWPSLIKKNVNPDLDIEIEYVSNSPHLRRIRVSLSKSTKWKCFKKSN